MELTRVTSSQMWKVCLNKGRLHWKTAKLFHFYELNKLFMPETFGPYHVAYDYSFRCSQAFDGVDRFQIWRKHMPLYGTHIRGQPTSFGVPAWRMCVVVPTEYVLLVRYQLSQDGRWLTVGYAMPAFARVAVRSAVLRSAVRTSWRSFFTFNFRVSTSVPSNRVL
jgi:hypothetical protein